MSIIGFSPPPKDENIRIGMRQMLQNYASRWDTPMLGALKVYVRFVDFKTDQAEKDAYADRYRFSGADRSKFYVGAFGPDSLEFLINQARTS